MLRKACFLNESFIGMGMVKSNYSDGGLVVGFFNQNLAIQFRVGRIILRYFFFFTLRS